MTPRQQAVPQEDPQLSSGADDSNPLVPPGWIKDEKSGRYVPDDKTKEEITRDQQTVKALQGYPSTDEDEEKQSWIWKPIVSPEEGAAFWGEILAFDPKAVPHAKQTEEKATAAGQPGRAARAAFGGGALESAGKLTSALTSPGQIGLTALTAGAETATALGSEEAIGLGKWLAPALRAPGRAAGAWFGLQGLKQLFTAQQEGESDADVWERRLLGASAFLGATGGEAGAVQDVLVKGFGLDPKLAAQVEERVTKLQQIRAERDASLHSLEEQRNTRLTALDKDTRRQVARAQQGMEQEMNSLREATTGTVANINSMAQSALDRSQGRITELERHQLHEGSQVVADAVRTVMELEGDRRAGVEGSLARPFREIGDTIKKPVTTETDVRSMLEANAASHGVKKEEIPAAVYKTLTKVSPEMEAAAAEDPSIVIGDVDFNHVTRLREDIYNAGASSKDGAVRGAMMASYEQLTEMQEKAADDANQGSKYRKAKGDWMQFKRSIGSGLMQEWLNAQDVKQQDMIEKVSKVVAPDDAAARAIRTTLKAYGIDTGPLDEYFRSIGEEQTKIAQTKAESAAGTKRAKELESKMRVTLRKGTAEQIRSARGVSKEQARAEDARTQAAIEPVKKGAEAQEREVERNPLIPGYTSEELAGKGNPELFKKRLQQMARSNSGIPVTGIVMMTYGLLKMSAFPFLYGVTRAGLPQLVKNPGFQDWLIEQAGVSPKTPEANRLKRVLNETVAPLLRKYARSGIPEVQAVEASKKKSTDQPPSRDELATQ